MRLVFVVTALGRGGAERHTIDLAGALAQRGHDCLILAIKGNMELAPECISVDAKNLGGNGYIDRSAIYKLADEINRFVPDLVVAVNDFALFYMYIVNIFNKKDYPLLVILHTTKPRTIKEIIQFSVYKYMARVTDVAVFVARAQFDYWQIRGFRGKKNVVIHNGVDINKFSPEVRSEFRDSARTKYKFSTADFVVGLCALLRPEKNHIQLVDAIAELRKNGVPAVALMIGDGQERIAIENHARKCSVENFVRITGSLADVRPAIAACDVITLCSTTEAFSLAALEAMGMGVPAVLSDTGGAREMVRCGENGYVFPVGDTPKLVELLSILYEKNTRINFGYKSSQRVELEFDRQKMVDKYEVLFSESCSVI